MSPAVSVVFVPVTPLSVSLLLLIFVIAAVPVMVFMVCVACGAPVISGWWCSAAVAAPVRGVAPQVPSCGGVSASGRLRAPLQAGGAQGVEEEALVGASQGTLQPGRGVNRPFNSVTHQV